ncbi:hypothetical protein SLE2022_038480 [Rubroshorea leprosula]
MSTQNVTHILVKALMAVPAPDFSLCLFLIPERVQMEEQFNTLIWTSLTLSGDRKIPSVWEEAAKSHYIVEAVLVYVLESGSLEGVFPVLSLTHQKVPRTVLAEAINIEGLSLGIFLGTRWLTVKIAADKGVPLEHITQIFPILG